MPKMRTILVESTEVRLFDAEKEEFISITDIAARFGEARILIQNWMRTRNTIDFLGTWELMHNSNFNRIEFDAFKMESGTNAFTMSPEKWILGINSIGLVSKKGRYGGGTFAHRDIALGFCYWINPTFQLYLIKEFQRLKEVEAAQSHGVLDWNVKRIFTKINYQFHTDAVKTHLVPLKITGQTGSGIVYASEADMLNMALFGITAKQWQAENPDFRGNMRDFATTEQLLVLANLENLNAHLIKEGLAQDERLEKLNEVAIYQMAMLSGSRKLKALK